MEMSEEIPKFKLGIILVGNIGMSPLLAMVLDERADRKDLDTVVATSGAKLGKNECIETTKKIAPMTGMFSILSLFPQRFHSRWRT